MNVTQSSTSGKDELLAKLRAKRHSIAQRIASDTVRLGYLQNEFNKFSHPLQVVNEMRHLWKTRLSLQPLLLHDDAHYDYACLETTYVNLEAKGTCFRKRVAQASELKEVAIASLPVKEELSLLEIPKLEKVLLLLEEDEKFTTYLDLDTEKIIQDWKEEKMYGCFIKLMEEMKELVDTMKMKIEAVCSGESTNNIYSHWFD